METQDNRKLYTGGIALGIIGIIFSVIFPAVSYSCSIPGLVLSVKRSRKGYKTAAAVVLNIISVSMAMVNSSLAMIITAKGFFKKRIGEV